MSRTHTPTPMTYWENNQPVDIVVPEHWSPADTTTHHADRPDPDFTTTPDSSGWWWPSREDRAIHLTTITDDHAARIADTTRTEVMNWLAGDGPNPPRILQRIHRLTTFTGLPLHADLATLPKNTEIHRSARTTPPVDPWAVAIWGTSTAATRRATESQSSLIGLLAHRKYHVNPDPRTSRDMLHHLLDELTADHTDDQTHIETRALSIAVLRRLLSWLTDDGHATPLATVQRWFALSYERYRDLIGSLTGEDIGRHILRQTRANFQELTERLFVQPSLIRTGVAMKVPGQKPASASPTYAANAALHKPKQQLTGDRTRTPRQNATDRTRSDQATKREFERRLEEARQKQIQRDAQDFENHIRAQRERREKRIARGKHTPKKP